MTAPETAAGRFFEDLRIGEVLQHGTPRKLRAADASLYSAAKNHPCADFPGRQGDSYHPSVVLGLDVWLLPPR